MLLYVFVALFLCWELQGKETICLFVCYLKKIVLSLELGHEIPGVDLVLFYVFIFWCDGYIRKKGLKGTALSPWLWKVRRSWCCKVYGSSCNPSSPLTIYKLTQSQSWYTKEEMRSAKSLFS